MSRQTGTRQTRHDDVTAERRPRGLTGGLRLTWGQTGLIDQLGSPADVRDYVRLVSEAGEELLHVTAVGCALADRRGELHVVAWSGDEVLDLGRRELEDGLGPGVDCYATGQPVVNVGRAEARRRWPAISTMLAEAGFGSLHELPLRVGGHVVGVLSLYSVQRRVLRTDELLMCQTLIHIAGTRLRPVTEPALVERSRSDGRTGARLEHPSMVSLLSTGDGEVGASRRGGGPRPSIVPEPGVSLRTLVGAGGGLKVDEALRITGDILCALTHAHEDGVVHGDLTATNVMLSTDGAVTLMNLGSSRAVTGSDRSAAQSVDVTSAYFSPDRAQGLASDTRADLHSVGCVLYELLTGHAPFVGDSAADPADRWVHEEPKPPSAHRPEIGAALDAVVLRALAKAPGARYQSALEFRVDLLAAGVETSRSAAPSDAP